MMSRGLVETLEARGTWAAERRLELRLCPSDIEGLEVLRPEVRHCMLYATHSDPISHYTVRSNSMSISAGWLCSVVKVKGLP